MRKAEYSPVRPIAIKPKQSDREREIELEAPTRVNRTHNYSNKQIIFWKPNTFRPKHPSHSHPKCIGYDVQYEAHMTCTPAIVLDLLLLFVSSALQNNNKPFFPRRFHSIFLYIEQYLVNLTKRLFVSYRRQAADARKSLHSTQFAAIASAALKEN